MLAVLLVLAAAAPEPYVPCAAPPRGMACIPGGPAIVGSDDSPVVERPKRTVEISTFYMDLHEVTNADYQACVAAGGCAPLDIPKFNEKIMVPFTGPNQPAAPLDWERAQKFCTWAGKRLPTEWEWEKAARGVSGAVYPWGNDEPTCDKAQYRECAPKGCKPYRGKTHEWDCVEHATKPVGSYPAGHYGLFDMAGNGYEWTSTWAGASPKCTIGCTGRDPLGPCDGASPCKDGGFKRVLRGGSWYWPKAQIKGSWRRPEYPTSKTHRLSARCAATSPVLTAFPSKLGSEKRPRPPTPKPPSDEQVKIVRDIKEDALDKQECADKGRSFLDCRDPTSYIRSNEPRQHVWRPYIENIGGGYTGVGIDQNYTFIAHARSEWAWLFDYDPSVVRLHWVLRAMILASPDRASFIAMFSPEKKDDALAILEKEYQGNAERVAYREIYVVARQVLWRYYERQLDGMGEGDPTFGWLANEESYAYVRTLYQQGRIHILKGDMLAKSSMQGIGAAARRLGVAIRVYYPSNAPECWPHTNQYKRNVLALPFDEDTVVLQTLSGVKAGFGKQIGYWHYNVQSGLQQQELMKRKGYVSLKQLTFARNKTDDVDLTLTGLAAAPR